VVDGYGAAASLTDARNASELAHLPVASTAELQSLSISRRVDELAVGCELPTRDGLFRAVAHASAERPGATVALIHGDPASLERPLVYAHVACLFGDAFGSLLCSCRAELDAAVAAIVAEGAGVIIYTKPDQPATGSCARRERTDAAVAAGLLRAARVRSLRLSGQSAPFADDLRARGMVLYQ
jgi:hypothetical protein